MLAVILRVDLHTLGGGGVCGILLSVGVHYFCEYMSSLFLLSFTYFSPKSNWAMVLKFCTEYVNATNNVKDQTAALHKES